MNALNTIRRAVIAPVVTWYNRQRMYEELNGLSDRVLADIGLTRAQIPTLVKQAYRPEPTVPAVSDMPALRAEPHAAASNDQIKQPLAA
ncbi:MAG: DUF1127 domain-containing protein [Rhodospirillales bacterium]|jgi:uncharacterized protein YjiS (DUF1127 family)|nr:DUF1127 domain-containing protein [Rhodospirillales bacterium]